MHVEAYKNTHMRSPSCTEKGLVPQHPQRDGMGVGASSSHTGPNRETHERSV